jgi:cation diffusion facilitator family transporter
LLEDLPPPAFGMVRASGASQNQVAARLASEKWVNPNPWLRGVIMSSHHLAQEQHHHRFDGDHRQHERNTRMVVGLTLTMMAAEIGAGHLFGSMALLADGWHMGTHAAALGITTFAYGFARRHTDNPHYSFGTGKVGILGGFASAVALAVIAFVMGAESIQRLFYVQTIRFNEAIAVGIAGLIVNLVSAWLLQAKESHPHEHAGHRPTHSDHNLRAAYLHVLADALTSVLAIIALTAGKFLGWIWMDPVMGLVGATIITRWSYGLLIDTGKILLDRDVSPELIAEIKSKIEADAGNQVADIHVWRVGSNHLSAIVSVVTHYPRSPEYYKKLISGYEDIVHLTVEVNSGPP